MPSSPSCPLPGCSLPSPPLPVRLLGEENSGGWSVVTRGQYSATVVVGQRALSERFWWKAEMGPWGGGGSSQPALASALCLSQDIIQDS